jgi:hypothetical protein
MLRLNSEGRFISMGQQMCQHEFRFKVYVVQIKAFIAKYEQLISFIWGLYRNFFFLPHANAVIDS